MRIRFRAEIHRKKAVRCRLANAMATKNRPEPNRRSVEGSGVTVTAKSAVLKVE
jgi:hypothetical protein